MFEKYKAHEILGVREDASREIIEKRYYILAKKHLILKRDNLGSEVPGLNMEKINEAYYHMIAKLNDNKTGKSAIGSDISKNNRNIGFYFLLDRLGVNRESAENFFYYYKSYVIISIAVLIIITIMLFPIFLGNGNEIINIVIFGNSDNITYSELSLNKLEDGIKNKLENVVENINEIDIKFLLIDEKLIIPDKINMMINAYNFITQGDYHILIMDKGSFDEYGIAANIAKLDDLVKELEIKNDKCYRLKLYGNEKEYVYGLNMDSFLQPDIFFREESLNKFFIVAMSEEFKNSKLHIKIIEALIS